MTEQTGQPDDDERLDAIALALDENDIAELIVEFLVYFKHVDRFVGKLVHSNETVMRALSPDAKLAMLEMAVERQKVNIVMDRIVHANPDLARWRPSEEEVPPEEEKKES